MDYSKETFPLNHFALWCKGWYRPTNEKATLEETLQIVFGLDGYPFAKNMDDFLNIVLTAFLPYNEWRQENGKKILTLLEIYSKAKSYEIYGNMHGYEVTVTDAVFYAIAGFFSDLSKEDIKLEKPIYSRELRTKGLCFRQTFRKDYQGMTYAEQNRIVSEIFDK